MQQLLQPCNSRRIWRTAVAKSYKEADMKFYFEKIVRENFRNGRMCLCCCLA